MRDAPLNPRPALVGRPPQRFGDLVIDGSRETTILLLLGKPGVTRESEFHDRLGSLDASELRASGPGQWFLILDRRATQAEIDAIAGKLTGIAVLVDQSHGRSRISITGADAPHLLAKGTSVDLDPAVASVGLSTATLFGHIGVHLSRTATDAYELLVLRSYAESLFDELCLLARSLPGAAAETMQAAERLRPS